MIFCHLFSYFIWDIRSELTIGFFSLRWNAVLIIAAYITSRQILFYIYKKEGKPITDAATFTTYLVIGALLGARVGHVILYQPELIWTEPLQIIFPFEFQPSFRFTGAGGFSVHGAALGILALIWLYNRKNKPGQKYFQLLDRTTISAAVAAFMILTGSMLNSDITGKRTESRTGTIFIKSVTKGLLQIPCCVMRIPGGPNPLRAINAEKDERDLKQSDGYQSVIIYLFFKPGASEKLVTEFLIGDVKNFLYERSQVVYEPGTRPLDYSISRGTDGEYIGRIKTLGVPRYPVQVFEAISYLLLSVLLFLYWNTHKTSTQPAALFGYFMTIFWALHFAYGFLKENETAVERAFDLCFVLLGIMSVLYSYQKSRRLLEVERGKNKRVT